MLRLVGTGPLNLLGVLSSLRTKALRSGLWFSTLSHEDRVLASLIAKNIKIVKNATLGAVIARIVSKLFQGLRNASFLSRIDAVGRHIAQNYSEKAYSMGNKDAVEWANDPNYIRYLGTMAYNENRSFSGTRQALAVV
jgi:hypothetical protein